MQSQATVNPVMTGHAVRFMRDPMGFVGMKLMPLFPSAEQSSQYYVWERANSLSIPRNIRHSPGAPFARSLPKISDDGFACRDWGHETPVPDEIRRKYANRIDADISAVRRNVEIIKVNHELRVLAVVNGATVPNATPSVKWNEADSDPKADVNAAKESIRQNTGLRANLMVISEPTKLVLEVHPKIAERVKYTTTGVTSLQVLAQYFGVAEIVVADQLINSAQEGQALSPADIWEDLVMLAHVNPARDLMVPTFGRTFGWQDFTGAEGIEIKSYRDETVASDVHRSRQFTDEKLVFNLAGYRLDDVLA